MAERKGEAVRAEVCSQTVVFFESEPSFAVRAVDVIQTAVSLSFCSQITGFHLIRQLALFDFEQRIAVRSVHVALLLTLIV